MKVIIAGSRELPEDFGIPQLDNTVQIYGLADQITEVVSGTARGADRLGEAWAQSKGIPIKRFPADWDRYGKRAGYLINAQMAEYGEILLALWDGKSRGTDSMIKLAQKKPLRVIVVNFDDK